MQHYLSERGAKITHCISSKRAARYLIHMQAPHSHPRSNVKGPAEYFKALFYYCSVKALWAAICFKLYLASARCGLLQVHGEVFNMKNLNTIQRPMTQKESWKQKFVLNVFYKYSWCSELKKTISNVNVLYLWRYVEPALHAWWLDWWASSPTPILPLQYPQPKEIQYPRPTDST